MIKIGFLGAGNMASAMVDGLLARQILPAADMTCFSASGTSAARLAGRTGIAQAGSPAELFAQADLLVVAFKPQHLDATGAAFKALSKDKLIVSVLSGKRLARLQQGFPQARNIVRTMPNTPARIGAGITAWCSLHPLTPADHTALESLLGALGQFIEVGEESMDAVTAVSASGAGFVFEFAGALCAAAVAAGLEPAIAKTLTVETLLGSARLLARTQEPPETLRNQVTSPNGTTLAGLQRMEARDFRGLMRETVLAAMARAGELSR
jgi:pyrroline-5-carboxylate reductase